MRLLQRSNTGEFSLTEDLAGDKAVPPYAILSHTWRLNTEEEVTFEDVTKGAGKDKPGYDKIRFCGEQAAQDNLEYFWIDTCCINKASHAELSYAINSMFRWYRNAARCYAYLSDVSSPPSSTNDGFNPQSWDSDFWKSKWFTRGWTLQELLAPPLVEFFSHEGRRLGDKNSLKQQIQEITGVPTSALQGTPLSQFSMDPFLWIDRRQTTRPEDKVYSLLGIFDVKLSLSYDEGEAKAKERLQEVINKRGKCIQELYLTDPRDDKKRIEDTKGGLLKDSYCWILENSKFEKWRSAEQSPLLWINGDPGKGKTMLLCGIINELHESTAKAALLSYFFCQATDSRTNDAIAVLRGLLYMLVSQQPSLVLHIQKKYDHAGKALFNDTNAWVALSEIFTNMLRDPSLDYTYFIVDALDECVTGLPKLLGLIVQTSSVSSRAKWIVSSRNWPSIERALDAATQRVSLSLELNEESVSAAIAVYIQLKVDWLAKRNRYSSGAGEAVQHYLSLNANGTFLWVALVCQELSNVPGWKAKRKLTAFPPGLDAFYRRMIDQIRDLEDTEDMELCKQILAVVSTVYRPLTLDELSSFVDMPEGISNEYEALAEIVALCGSFLTLRERTIAFVHQSAKDFLVEKAYDEIYPSKIEYVHHTISSRSLQVMSENLGRNIYGLSALGFPINQVKQPDPDPLSSLQYSCIYWIDHLLECDLSKNATNDLHDGGSVDKFLRRSYLYWLEALSLYRSLPEGMVSMVKLEALVQASAATSMLLKLVQDARRFVVYHKQAIENYPLQGYMSALMFSPAHSSIRSLFKYEEPKWITIMPPMGEWSACLQTLKGHESYVRSVAFSHNSTRLASASWDRAVKIWDTRSGASLQTLKGHTSNINSLAFSHDSTQLASASDDKTVKLWDACSGICLQTFIGHGSSVNSIAFSHDSARLVSMSNDYTIRIWDTSSGTCLQTLYDKGGCFGSAIFSHNSTQLASISHRNVKIWDASSSTCLQTLTGHENYVTSVTFSHDSTRLASASEDKTVKIWDTSSCVCIRTLEGHGDKARSVAFSHDSTRLASGSEDNTVKIWDVGSGACLQTLKGHSSWVYSLAFSHDSTRLTSASDDKTLKIWDTSSGAYTPTLNSHSSRVNWVAFSHDSTRLASASNDSTIKIWDTKSGTCLQTLQGCDRQVSFVVFSHDSAKLASAGSYKVKIWDTSSGACLRTLYDGGDSTFELVAFSHNSIWLASGSSSNIIKIWDLLSGTCLKTLYKTGHHYGISAPVTFSHDSTRLALGAWDWHHAAVEIWDVSSGACLQRLEGHNDMISSVVFSHDSTWLASTSRDKTVKIWDVSSGACFRTLEVGKELYGISFDSTNLRLYTSIGTITIDGSSSTCTPPAGTEPEGAFQGAALSVDGAWMTYDSENVVRLPSEEELSCSAVSAKTVAIGFRSGRVYICNFDADKR